MEERYHATTQNRFYPDMSNVNKNITVEEKLISPHTYFLMSARKINVPVTCAEPLICFDLILKYTALSFDSLVSLNSGICVTVRRSGTNKRRNFVFC